MAKPLLTAALKGAIKVALENTAARLDTRFQEEFNQADWKYPTEPKVRDIVDTGRLRDSQQLTLSPEGAATFTWSAPYATQVHEGGVTTDGVRFPGRPWTRDPIAELPTIFGEELGSALQRGGGQP
jgi:hypothetical protein